MSFGVMPQRTISFVPIRMAPIAFGASPGNPIPEVSRCARRSSTARACPSPPVASARTANAWERVAVPSGVVITGSPAVEEVAGQRVGGVDHGGRVVVSDLLPVEQGHRQCGGVRGVEVGGEAGECDCVDALGDPVLGGDQEPGGWAGQALVRAHGHDVGAVVQRVRPRTAGDQARQMGGVEEHGRADLVGDLADGGDGVVGEVEARPDGDHPRSHPTGECCEFVDVDGVARSVDGSLVDLEAVEARPRPLRCGSRGRRSTPVAR